MNATDEYICLGIERKYSLVEPYYFYYTFHIKSL